MIRSEPTSDPDPWTLVCGTSSLTFSPEKTAQPIGQREPGRPRQRMEMRATTHPTTSTSRDTGGLAQTLGCPKSAVLRGGPLQVSRAWSFYGWALPSEGLPHLHAAVSVLEPSGKRRRKSRKVIKFGNVLNIC